MYLFFLRTLNNTMKLVTLRIAQHQDEIFSRTIAIP